MAQPIPDEKNLKSEALKADLFISITRRDPAGVKSALARGAGVNERNWLAFTPLMWAAGRGNREVVDLLLSKGAIINDSSIYGAALTFAAGTKNEDIALSLLGRGAQPNPSRIDGINPLMLAAGTGQQKLLARLLKLKVDPNIKDSDGDTGLIWAARLGQSETTRALLAAGAGVDAADSHGMTALMLAAMNGHRGIVDTLIGHKAAVNARDKSGATALLLASRYCGDGGVIRSLLKHGANPSSTDGFGKTALALAVARGYQEAANELRQAGAQAGGAILASDSRMDPHKAVENSISAIQAGMKVFGSRTPCSSCHHQGLGLMTVGLAAKRGFATDRQLVGSYLQKLGAEGMQAGPAVHRALKDPDMAKSIQATDIGDNSIGGAYILGGLLSSGIPPNPGLGDAALFLARGQAEDGHWGFGLTREPIQSSQFTTTALVLRVMRTYAPIKSEQVIRSYEMAKQWLLTTPAPTAEDKASRILALKFAGATKAEMEKPIAELVAAQRPDGGWARYPAISDAYASGLALYSLRVGAGTPASDPAIQRGVAFLLRTQDEDGTWYVNKRAFPANTYFDAGFPHGQSQFISFGATCWATMALIECDGSSQTASR